MKERCWVRVHMKLICSTVFVYFGVEGYKQYSKYLADDQTICPDMKDLDGNTYAGRCWVKEELDISTLVHELHHIAVNIGADIGINTEEFHAYVQGYIFEEVTRKRKLITYKEKPCKK